MPLPHTLRRPPTIKALTKVEERAFKMIFEQIQKIAVWHSVPIDLHFVFNDRALGRRHETEMPLSYAFLDDMLCANGAASCVWHNVASTDGLRVLTSTDIVVTSKAMYSTVAALLTRGIVLFAPKQYCGASCLSVSEAFLINEAGEIALIDEFNARMSMLLYTARFQSKSPIRMSLFA